jgi:precorrin-2 dehydrogenase / sirohydrochlorin ferrochelatase
MKYYPISLNLKGRRVLVVGAGDVALQKLGRLLACQARVHVVAPAAIPKIQKLARDARIRWSRRAYKAVDLKGASLVIAATDDSALQKTIAAAARVRKIWVNVVDVPPLCDFIAPAVVTRGDIQIAISTGGAAPALAKHLRRKLESWIGPEYADFALLVKKWRPELLKLPKERRLSLWECIASDAFIDEIKREGIAKAEARLKDWIYARHHD